jgi:hypothetical protein
MNDDTWARMMTLGITLNNNRKNSLASKLSFKYVLVRFYIYIMRSSKQATTLHWCCRRGRPVRYDTITPRCAIMDVPLLVTLSIMICLCTRQSGSIALCYVDLLGALVVTFFSICAQEVAEKAEWASKLRAAWSMCFDSRLSFLSNSFSPDESRTLLNNIKWWICAARVRSMRHICKSRHSILPVCV